MKEKTFEEIQKSLIKEEWNSEKKMPSAEKETVYLKKEPSAIAMRIFKETEDYETQLMRECEAFYKKHAVYPNGVVTNPETLDRWQARIEDSAAESEADDYLEQMTFAQIKAAKSQERICEISSSEDGKATMFKTSDYELYILENTEYQDGVYQLFNGYSPALENGKFTYPLIDMKATGKKIRALMNEQGITPAEIQNVCALSSLQAVYKWFAGKSVPSIDNLGIISNLLNTPIDDLVVFKNRKD